MNPTAFPEREFLEELSSGGTERFDAHGDSDIGKQSVDLVEVFCPYLDQ
jgi:hypothetical protein